jgi:hypothetical protein
MSTNKPARWRKTLWNAGWYLPILPAKLRKWLYNKITPHTRNTKITNKRLQKQAQQPENTGKRLQQQALYI